MIVVGLTGSIASGKSEVAKRLAYRGMPVFDADEAVHELYATRSVAASIDKLFPGTMSHGKVNRAKLAEHLVKRPSDFPALEAIVHPKVHARMQEFVMDQKAKGTEIIVLDVPLLLETGGDKIVDHIVLVTADPGIQRGRALQRPGMTESKLAIILARQMPVSEKTLKADFVVENSGSFDDLEAKVDQLVYDLRTKRKG
jgi:dephospho-CoA kinase